MKKLSLGLLIIPLLVVAGVGWLIKPELADEQNYWLSIGWTCVLVLSSWYVTGLYLQRGVVNPGEADTEDQNISGVVPSFGLLVNVYGVISFVLLWSGWVSEGFSQLPRWHWVSQTVLLGIVAVIVILTTIASTTARVPVNNDLVPKERLLKKIHIIKSDLPDTETATLNQLKELDSTIRHFIPHLSRVTDPGRYKSLGDQVMGVDASLTGDQLAEFLRSNVQRWVAIAKSCQ